MLLLFLSGQIWPRSCSVLEGETEVAARSLIIGVALRWRGEVSQKEDLSGLKRGASVKQAVSRLTFLKNQNILNGQKPGKALKRRELGWGV